MRCDFLDYRGGILSGGYYCTKKGDYIDTHTKDMYCDNSLQYRECPIYRGGSSSGGCYLTSACVNNRGLADDCDELTTLRNFRDGYMKSQPGGEAEIKEYYDNAPKIVEKIDGLCNRKEIYDKIYDEVIVPCVKLIKNGDNEAAHDKYRGMVKELEAAYL